jgi:hypothetical protein
MGDQLEISQTNERVLKQRATTSATEPRGKGKIEKSTWVCFLLAKTAATTFISNDLQMSRGLPSASDVRRLTAVIFRLLGPGISRLRASGGLPMTQVAVNPV